MDFHLFISKLVSFEIKMFENGSNLEMSVIFNNVFWKFSLSSYLNCIICLFYNFSFVGRQRFHYTLQHPWSQDASDITQHNGRWNKYVSRNIFLSTFSSLCANPLAKSLGPVLLKSNKWKLWKNLFE
jgi:hypothetical protein